MFDGSSLSPPDGEALLRLWERGENEHPLDRALSLLAAFCHRTRHELAALDIGTRDALLFRSRALLFGASMEGFTTCERCSCAIETAMTVPDFELTDFRQIEFGERWWPLAPTAEVEYRLPTSHDLVAIVECTDVNGARNLLRGRCIRGAGTGDEAILLGAEQAIERRVEAAALNVELTCPSCEFNWSVDFDIGRFFWEEVRACAKRLLREVDALARRYGWSESEILSLSDARRRHYLELEP